jgi:hypothetical protein
MIRALIILLTLFALDAGARADIAFVAASDFGYNGCSSSNFTNAFTATGGNLLLITVVGDYSVLDGGTGNDDITSVTYAGTSATLVIKHASNDNANRFSYLYFLQNPASGSNNVVINTATTPHCIASMAAVYSGLGSSGAIPGASSQSLDSGANNSFATSFATAPDRAWAILMAQNAGGGTTPTCTSGATYRVSGISNTSVLCDSNGPVTPPQSYSMTATISTTTTYQTHLMAAFGPDAGGLMMRGCCQ